jgi:hypothetical protein
MCSSAKLHKAIRVPLLPTAHFPKFQWESHGGSVAGRQKATTPHKTHILRILLEGYFRQAGGSEAKAISRGENPPPRLEPDEAIRRLDAIIQNWAIEELIREGKIEQFSLAQKKVASSPIPLPTSDLYCKYHHIAVDLYYKTYAHDYKGAGRPRSIPDDYYQHILEEKWKKKSYLQIAKDLGEPVGTAEEKHIAKEKIRQQYRNALKWLV